LLTISHAVAIAAWGVIIRVSDPLAVPGIVILTYIAYDDISKILQTMLKTDASRQY